MVKADVLDKVAADLARGQTQPAIQRLASLVAAHPADLELRRRLAAAHRLVGNAVQAGRWGYLNADADPAETTAFERAYPSARRRLAELSWPSAQGHPATEFARQRLAGLLAIARPAAPAGTERRADVIGRTLAALTGGWAPFWRRQRTRRAALMAASVAAPFAILGASTVAAWIVG